MPLRAMRPICNWHAEGLVIRRERWHPVCMRSRRTDPVAARLEALGFERTAAVRLSLGGSLLDVPAGTALCRQGEAGLEAFVLVDGEVDVLLDDRVVTLGAGEVVGELAALDATRVRNATVVASTDLT